MSDRVMMALWVISMLAWLGMAYYLRFSTHRTDGLTGVFGVAGFHERLGRLIERRKEIHIVALELCQLKKINRLRGMECGDQLLAETARMLLGISRWNRVYRVTGRRFVIVTYSIAEYDKALREVRMFFAHPVDLGGEEVSSPATVCGITDASRLGSSAVILEYIEYLASLVPAGAENMTVQDDDQTLKGFRYTQEVENFLDTAIKQDLFEVQYQPVYSLEKGRYMTLEALSRLRHPSLGPVSPDIFISLAEKNDQMPQMGLLQMRRICRYVCENDQLLSCVDNIKINLSPTELMKSGHVDRLISIIREYKLPTSFFQFEITETAATEYSEQLRLTAAKLTQAGIGLCLDDFGSGYANLNTVLKLPFSEIKLDKSLLNGIDEDSRVAAFYRNIVAVLKNMGYAVIAEGVETARELELVSRWGIDMIQGYYFARPIKEKDVMERLRAGKQAFAPSDTTHIA